MKTTWYCTDCETQIETNAIDEHEHKGHHVRGVMKPDRLIGNNPWNLNVHHDSEEGQ
jgi:hypothetical protein